MLADPRVSLMVMAVPSADVAPQALARFPSSAQTFELSDFALFAIRPTTARFVGGFAQAKTIGPETLAAVLGGLGNQAGSESPDRLQS